ncbi:alpha/beta hydrolase [Oleiharenicola lentus]|uniref:alpha/beta hydrolase n=1 Tax=Oleiharenicola lentus TaxID=2508720 RepID=UPI003F67F257
MKLFLGALASILFGISAHAEAPKPIIFLYQNGAPGSEARRGESERITGTNVSNIHNPSVTAYFPSPDTATGCAVLIAPGGGHERLAIQHEGYAVAQWLADHGVAAFVLKYRLAKDNATPAGTPQPYTIERDELGDAQRAIRLIRARATEWNLNPNAIGMMGFSAGGLVTLLAATHGTEGQPHASDPIDRASSKLNFAAPIYPGGLDHPDLPITKETPPLFLLCGANDRPRISEVLPEFYLKSKKAGVDAELHILAGLGHGFGLKADNSPHAAATWISLFRDWLENQKISRAL